MGLRSQPPRLSPAARTRAARLAPYLGDELAARVAAPLPRDQDLFLAASLLAGARYAVSTYLPRRLLDRQLAGAGPGPWLEWVEGALLFADVSGSTALAERLTVLGPEGSELVTETLDSYFGPMIQAIQEAGGDLLTFGGDALLVLFEGPDGARAATATALGLLRDRAGFERTVPGIGSFPLTMHIGVAAGPVALVSAGQPHALRYSAMGATINAVARAEQHGGAGELVLDPAAWALVADAADGELVPESGGFVRVRALAGRAPFAAPTSSPLLPPAYTAAALDRLSEQIARISPYLPADLLVRIVAEPTRPRVEADLRPVTVLFAQVTGLGPLVERLPPAEAAAAVDAFLRPMQAAVEQFGGFVNKLDLADEGDKLMAVFGAPIALEDHAERAARAALAMIAARSAAAGTWGEGLQLRIGLNTGNVFAGNVGAAERKEYTVMGDAVNLAARVLAQSAWGEVRCTAATAALIRWSLATADPRHVRVRGKNEPVELLRLVGERATPMPHSASPLVGRDRELGWLREQLAAAQAGRGRVVRLVGEAGVGKSRLAAALLAEARAAGAATFSVRCLAYNSAAPYTPWGELVRALCGIAGPDNQPARLRKLAAALSAADVAPDDWLPLVADLAHLDAVETPVTRALDPQQRRERRFAIVLELLRNVSDREPWSKDESPQRDPSPLVHAPRPLVVSFDNLQWADQVSLDLWQHVAAQIAGAPILLLGLHRGPLTWGSGPQGDAAAQLELGPLHVEASAALLDSLAAPERLEPELRERIVARAAGNPLFLEELLRAVEGGAGAVDTLPDSLSGLLLARIDRLDERSRALLRVAAVVGQRFPVGVVQSVHERDYAALVRSLAQLDAEELTAVERELPERIHLFRHALLHEVAYQSLLYARRRELHRRIGEHLEARYADELAAVQAQYVVSGDAMVQIGRNGAALRREARPSAAAVFLLAHHFRLSDAPERAISYLLLAGHSARDDYANDQAMQHYSWAIELAAPGDPRAWEAREALGDVLCVLGRYEDALAEYEAMQVEALPPAVAAEVLRSQGDALEKQGQYAVALERLRAAEALCRAHLNSLPPLLLAAIYADMGQVLRRLGEFDAALDVCRTGLSMVRADSRSVNDERIEADLQMLMGALYATRGDYEAARFHFENGLAAQEAIEDLYGCARSHNNLGYLAQLQSDYQRAVRHYAEAETLARKVSAKFIVSSVLLNAAYGYYRLDRYAEAESACQDGLKLCEEMGEQDGTAKAYDTLGLIAFNRGRYAEARDHYAHSLRLHRALGSYEEAYTLANLASAQLAAGDQQAARTAANQALEMARRVQSPQLEVEALNALVEVCLSDGEAAELARAAELAVAATEGAERLGSRLDYGVACRLRGELAAARGEPFAALFEEALATFAAIRSAFEQARTEARFGEALAACNDPAAAPYLKRAAETFRQIGAGGELGRLGFIHERS